MLRLPAPAKLNLFLHVTGRRPDGYHELQTVFQFIDLCDEVVLSPRPDGRIQRGRGAPGVAPEDDLALRAAHALKRAGHGGGADISVEKRIPMGGGLGGGSSDAAAVLRGLNVLWGLGLTPGELAAIGLELGADVPVFVAGGAAFAEGVGERLSPVSLPCPHYLVVYPGVSVSTAAVFGHGALTRSSTSLKIRGLFSGSLAVCRGAGAPPAALLHELFARTRNDCEAVVRSLHPEVAMALDWLRTRDGLSAPPRMTGTGACVFAAFESRGSAEAALAGLPAGASGIVARGLNESPLLPALDAAGPGPAA